MRQTAFLFSSVHSSVSRIFRQTMETQRLFFSNQLTLTDLFNPTQKASRVTEDDFHVLNQAAS